MNLEWRNYFLSIQSIVGPIPPIDAQYWVSTANSTLTNERNIGALATGYLKITTAAGVATPATVTPIPAADVSSAALTRVNDTNVTVTLGGTPTTALLAATSLTMGWAGTLAVGRGGTGADNSTQTYTPTLTAVANVAASTAYQCQYARIGSTVMVSGQVDVDPTAAGTLTQLGISIPIASNFANFCECAGAAADPGVSGYSAAIRGDAVNDRAELAYTTGADVANRSWFFSFLYQVI